MNSSLKKSFASGLGAFICVALLITLGTSLPSVQAAPAGFVAPCGTTFCLNGQVFNVAGTNNHYLGWGTQPEVDQVFNDAKAMDLNVVRTIMHSVRGSLDSTQMNQGTMPLKWNWGSTADSSNMGMHGVYLMYWDTVSQKMLWNDSTTDGLGRWDYVIWKAKQLGLKLDISLLDFWQWAGGVQQIDANFKGGNYDVSNAPDRYTFFFTDGRTQQFYRDWVNHVLNRVNTLTGVMYKDEPTIFAWDLMNEPEMANPSIGIVWISQMSAYVKSIDPNHMVASGNEGFADGHAGSSPQLEMTIPTIDFATWHTYPTYHNISPQDVVNLIGNNCQIAAMGHKPVILQEFGYPSTNGGEVGVYQSWVNAIDSNTNCAGWMFWRLTAREQNGQYPPDNGEHFDVHNDGGAAAQVFKLAADLLIARGGAVSATNVPTSPATDNPTDIPTAITTDNPTNIPTDIPPATTTDIPVIPTDAEIIPTATLTPTTVLPDTPALSVAVNPAAANPGDPVAITLNLSNVTNLYGLEVTCQVDPTVLVGNNLSASSGFNGTNSYLIDYGFNAAGGTWHLAASRLRPNPAITGSDVAFVMNYMVQSAGSTAVNCTALAVDNNGYAIPVDVINGLYGNPTASAVTPTSATPLPITDTPTVSPPTEIATPAPGSQSIISGVVNYPGETNHAGITVAILAADGSPLAQVVTNADGAYNFTDVPIGAYILQFSAAGSLVVQQSVLVASDGSTVDVGKNILPMGDTDNNGVINLNDAALIGANIGNDAPPAPGNADLNADGVVNIIDLTVIGVNYNLTGPVVVNPP